MDIDLAKRNSIMEDGWHVYQFCGPKISSLPPRPPPQSYYRAVQPQTNPKSSISRPTPQNHQIQAVPEKKTFSSQPPKQTNPSPISEPDKPIFLEKRWTSTYRSQLGEGFIPKTVEVSRRGKQQVDSPQKKRDDWIPSRRVNTSSSRDSFKGGSSMEISTHFPERASGKKMVPEHVSYGQQRPASAPRSVRRYHLEDHVSGIVQYRDNSMMQGGGERSAYHEVEKTRRSFSPAPKTDLSATLDSRQSYLANRTRFTQCDSSITSPLYPDEPLRHTGRKRFSDTNR
ncbi:hypothetical protein BLNAU_19429 [Blattamonas nauphoetae]|uniref:Uncharacterized protein n=1 Tax=Blattamonas nauphoetae TaxID=2049346 RepID=A0ABQ9X1G8_9EUKA|nr:hypothetical protein BLNAU_19429 [Blattamonas nauphoetae]